MEKLLPPHIPRPILPLNDLNAVDYLGKRTQNGVVLVTKGVGLAWEKHPPRASVSVKPLVDGLFQNTDPRWVKLCFHVVVLTLLYMPLVQEGVIVRWNWEICVVHGLGDLLQAHTRDDLIEADWGALVTFKNNYLMEWPM